VIPLKSPRKIAASSSETAPYASPTRKPCVEFRLESTLQGCFDLCHAIDKSNPGKQKERTVLALNFASAKNPGGGFLGGSQAQEESLARSSALYHCLDGRSFYEVNRKDPNRCLYYDGAIYSPDVVVFRDDSGAWLDEPVLVSFLTVPAPNAGAAKKNYSVPDEEIAAAVGRRVRIVLQVAMKHGHRDVVLGAFGTGVFRNDIRVIASAFRHEIDRAQDSFDTIRFSIIDKPTLDKFVSAYGPL